ncbi:MAG: FimB/Mfa2 family fimbrial subunit [Parabacteroides distasonis]
MNRFSNLLIKSIGALTLTGLAACDYIHDDSIAPCEYRLRLVYDYNMKFTDAFQREVDKASLFICDNKGNFIRRQDIEGAELKANSIAMDLEPGTYQVLTWAGLDESSYQWPELTPGSSTIEEIRVKTLREADATQPNELTPLWHALDTLVIAGDRHEEKEISLAKNTNKLRVVLQDTEGYSMDVKDFSFRIVADNGYMDYDNTLLDDDTISYLPYHTESVDIAAGSADDRINGKPANQYVAVAELNTMRLMAGENYRLIVRHKDWENDVLNVNLNQYLLLTQMEGHDIPAQEYLDRQDEYSIVFFLTPIICPDCPDPDPDPDPDPEPDPDPDPTPDPDPEIPDPEVPIVGYACYKIQVKDWVIRLNNGEL